MHCGSPSVADDWRCAACGFEPAGGPFPVFARHLGDGADGFAVDAFDELPDVEAASFWFASRNLLLQGLVRRYFPHARSLLEVGCGTGFVLAGFAEAFPHLALTGVEASLAGLTTARTRVPAATLLQMDATRLAWSDEFDVVGSFDVLEHLDDDAGALAEMARAVRRGGGVIVAVPQHRWLWSADDEYGRHRRRYDRAELLAKIAAAGLVPLRTTSFVSLLLPAMAVSRWSWRLPGRVFDPRAGHSHRLRTRAALGAVMRAERALIWRGVPLPFGGSLVVLARRV